MERSTFEEIAHTEKDNSGNLNKRFIGENAIQCSITWNRKVSNTNLEEFQQIVEKNHGIKFNSYWELHKWSIDNLDKHLAELWSYFGIIYSKPYEEVFSKTGDSFTDNVWFKGALFNFAENCLRIRDDTVAMVCLDESLNEETLTYAELYEEVRLYAAAFRKNGLKKGDRVACYMSNRKEAFIAMFATVSIGAIWGGPLPYYGARVAANLVKLMEPKFLIAVDSYFNDGKEHSVLHNLPTVVNYATTLERVILVVTKQDTYKKNISHIPNCSFLEDFLKEGITADGNVPDIIFEQLPFDHPICINFTSGTTGLPKCPVHSAGTLLHRMQYHALFLNSKKGDTMLTTYVVGWALWHEFVPCFSLGVKLVLLCGRPDMCYKGTNYWDICAKYKVAYVILVSSKVDKMEKMNIVPSQDSSLDCLKVVALTGSPAKKENFEYIRNKVHKDAFVVSSYGSTEGMGEYSGFNINMPVYGGEIQIPALGVDIQCFDEKGNSVVGQRGELVICSPHPNFPLYLWRDTHNNIIKRTYLSKYPGVWYQGDACWVNPKTKGMVVFGRSDNTIKQRGGRFDADEIYFAIHDLKEVEDYICVGQQKYDGDSRAVLFVKMQPGYKFTPEVKAKIEKTVCDELWDCCVPELILDIPEIPYNLNNKRMESVVKKIVATNKIPEVLNIRNPDSLKYFLDIPEVVCYNQR